MKRQIFFLAMLVSVVLPASAAIRRDPNGVNVNSQGATTVFITFGGLQNQVPVEAFWCGELISASPDIGQKCRPDTIFGRLPIRYDQSNVRGSVFTDIMSIPQTVVRRAYEAAARGENSSFFYVRRFTSPGGGPDEYVFVTCRMAGMGARTPLALTDVQLRFEIDSTILPVRPGESPPPFFAELKYNGTGRLKGRWEVVVPGQETPETRDLLTEATLPMEERATQRRYAQVERFNVYLPPTGSLRLAGPDPAKLPTAVEGPYQILFRVEASDDKESDSNLAAAGAGTGVVHSGGVAGFPMPVLRYYVGHGGSVIAPAGTYRFELLGPAAGGIIGKGESLEFRWDGATAAPFHRLEVRDGTKALVLSAVVESGTPGYRAPAWLGDRVTPGRLQWRLVALNRDGEELAASAWRDLHYGVASAR